MKVALVFAAASLRRGTRLKHFMVPPSGLQILGALTPPEHEVTIYDEYHQHAPETIDADLVGISVWTAAANRAYELADTLRSKGLPVVLGGPHVSIYPYEAKRHADCVVVGEAEGVWRSLLQDFERGQLKQEDDHAGKSEISRTALSLVALSHLAWSSSPVPVFPFRSKDRPIAGA
jgi:radical SAM superfamily enzyme YgiQ (UPF0313 family)